MVVARGRPRAEELRVVEAVMGREFCRALERVKKADGLRENGRMVLEVPNHRVGPKKLSTLLRRTLTFPATGNTTPLRWIYEMSVSNVLLLTIVKNDKEHKLDNSCSKICEESSPSSSHCQQALTHHSVVDPEYALTVPPVTLIPTNPPLPDRIDSTDTSISARVDPAASI